MTTVPDTAGESHSVAPGESGLHISQLAGTERRALAAFWVHRELKRLVAEEEADRLRLWDLGEGDCDRVPLGKPPYRLQREAPHCASVLLPSRHYATAGSYIEQRTAFLCHLASFHARSLQRRPCILTFCPQASCIRGA